MKRIVQRLWFKTKLQDRSWYRWMLGIWRWMLELDYYSLFFSIHLLKIGSFPPSMLMLLIWFFTQQCRKWLLTCVKIQGLLLNSWKREIFPRRLSMIFSPMFMTMGNSVFKVYYAINFNEEKISRLKSINKNCKRMSLISTISKKKIMFHQWTSS